MSLEGVEALTMADDPIVGYEYAVDVASGSSPGTPGTEETRYVGQVWVVRKSGDRALEVELSHETSIRVAQRRAKRHARQLRKELLRKRR